MTLSMLRVFGLLLLAIATGRALAAKEPTISISDFESAPAGLFYFDDSDVVIVQDIDPAIVYRSTDAGASWKKVEDLPEGEPLRIQPHPYVKDVAVAMTMGTKHWVTHDRGESWRQIKTEFEPMRMQQPIVFHASNPDKYIFLTAGCENMFECKGQALYTVDGGKTVKMLRDNIEQCIWAKGSDNFRTGDDDLDENQVLCITEGKYSPYTKDQRLLISNDYFETEWEPAMDSGRVVQGVVHLAAVKGYIAVAAISEGRVDLNLYITDNVKTWHPAIFDGHALEEGAYTILESTNYSIQVDVLKTHRDNAMGTLFTSNSNGTYFTKNIEHTNRNDGGLVDFEKIQNIQGLVLVNIVKNWEEAERSIFTEKEIVSRISFDDGRKWQPLKVGKNDLHLHSVTDQRNAGRIFSSPAPGLVMGVGNTGKYLRPWGECDTYVSDDGGVTWKLALEKPHLYEFGDKGAILVAVQHPEANKIMYSINHGKDWSSFKLDDEVRPLYLQTVPDSTSLKFILTAKLKRKYVTIFLDFSKLHERECKEKDFEKWPARVDDEGKPTCIMGHKQFYRRRKADADCFVNEEFVDPVPTFEKCPCTDADYECDFNFVRDETGKKCVPTGALRDPAQSCKKGDKTFKGSSGFRLIPGNACTKDDGIVKDAPVDRPCEETQKPSDGKVTSELTEFDESNVKEFFYLQREADEDGDTVVMQTSDRHVYITHDHGKTWLQPEELEDEEVIAIYPHSELNDVVYFITLSKRVYYSYNRGRVIHHFDAPEAPNTERLQILSFHPKEKDWLIWTGRKDCKSKSTDCASAAHISTNGGAEWKQLLAYVGKCQFVGREDWRESNELVYCEQHKDEDPNEARYDLVASSDEFKHKNTPLTNIISFATMAEFIVVAVKDVVNGSLRVETSIDGKTFAFAQFPSNFVVKHQQAYTVLDSATRAIFLHVTVNGVSGQEYGTILKSNSNGTSYVTSIDHVNRNGDAYVDFEKMQGLEGVALVNIVSNVDDVESGAQKKLRTMITHNDGAEWAPIKPPAKDSDDKAFDCKDTSIEGCALHLHGYTERRDPRDTFSSASAVGLMMGVGNVGPHLGTYKQGDTFITRDGGITWHEVFKGTYMWEYGDQGSIIVIVKQDVPVKEVFYSRDEGTTWIKYEFSKNAVIIDDISTVPADTSRNFLLWGRSDDLLITVNLDFSGLTDRICTIDEANPGNTETDYDLWSPRHPLSESDCLFGHKAEYHRKKLASNCWNGYKEIIRLHNQSETCPCTRQDFECDYNYQRQQDGSCKLVEGYQPPDHSKICETDPDAIAWYEPTGYRRIPLTTCQGGRELEYSAQSHPCPGKEPQYKDMNGIGGFALFLAIVLPISVAALAGWWVWRNWDGKFGRIRLGDGGPGLSGGGSSRGGSMFSSESPFVRYPVLAISGVVAVLAAVPLLFSSLWRAAQSRFGRRGGDYAYSRPYTSRGSFQRSRGDLPVDEDEGELLGDESDEEV